MKIAANEMMTYRWSFEEDIANYAQAGYAAVGVWRQKLADFGEEKGAELIREAGLTVSSLHWIGGFTGSDGRGYDDSIIDAKEAIELAASLNAGCVVAYTGSRGGHTRNHARRLARGALKEVCQHAQQCNVTVAIEPMHIDCGSDWTFLNSLEDSLELLEDIGGDKLKIVCDAYHIGFCDRAISILPAAASQIGLVQLADANKPPDGEQNRCRLGEGELPLQEIVTSLCEAGYAGAFEIELLGEDVEQFEYGDLLEHSLLTAQKLLS